MKKEKRIRNYFKNLVSEFKTFISKGNILEIAIAFILGGAFGAIVKSLVNDIISPLTSALFKKESLSSMYFTFNNAKVMYGSFIQAIIDFLTIASVIFMMLKIVMKIKSIAEINKKFALEIQNKFDNNIELDEKEKEWMIKAEKKKYKNIPKKREIEKIKTDNEKIIELLSSINEKLNK